MFRLDLLQNDRVRYAGQPIAVVIAETLEAATEGASLLAPRYEIEPARVGSRCGGKLPAAGRRPRLSGASASRRRRGRACRVRQSTITATYETAAQYHNPMEPHAIVAAWDGDTLSIDTPSQGLAMAQGRLAGLFGISPDKIHIRSPFLGGGFGCKGLISGPQVLGAIAARAVGRPVKLVLRREQMFGPVGHRAPTRQTLRLGTDGDGALAALDHRTKTMSSTFDDFFEPASNVSQTLYASTAIATSHEAVRADIGTPLFMRAPGEATGSIALESAIDEMAQACGMDPLAFRLKNYAEVEPISGKPFSSKALRECYRQGAERFGWERRPLAPRQMRDRDGLLVGWGVGTATFPGAHVRGASEGGAAPGRQRRHGDRRARYGPGRLDGAGADRGRWARARSRSARVPFRHVRSARCRHCRRLGPHRDRRHGASTMPAPTPSRGLLILRPTIERSPLFGAGNAGVIARGGRLFRRDDASRSESYADILARAGLAADRRPWQRRNPNPMDAHAQSEYAMHAHGAVFAEVKVDPDLGQMRVTRVVGAFAAGRIINPRMVQSQFYGGMIWGVSFALA